MFVSLDLAAIVVISALLLVFALIIAFMIHIVSSDARDFDYEMV